MGQNYFLQVSYHEIFSIKIFIVYVKLYLISSFFTSQKETFSDVWNIQKGGENWIFKDGKKSDELLLKVGKPW